MASWLVLDWDHDQFHILSAQSSRRGVQVVKAATWPHPEPFTPSTAERVGKALQAFLKSAGIAPAPGRGWAGARPHLPGRSCGFRRSPPMRKPPWCGFQTAKELTEPGDNFAVDYMQMNGDTGDRQIMTVAARRDIVSSAQTLCQSAGLKLHAVTPRLFGIAAAIARAVHPDPDPLTAGKLSVVLALGQRWAELSFFNGSRLIQAQAISNGPLLVNEVKRNLAVFQAQHAVDLGMTGPDCLFVFGDDASAMQTLQNGQQLPIRMLNPLREEPEVAGSVKNPGFFAGAVGLASLWSHSIQRPVNLSSPRKAQPPSSISMQRGMIYGGVAAGIALFCIGWMYYVLADKQDQIDALTKRKEDIDKVLTDNMQERAELESYKEWEQSTIPWLDEIYDLTARYPYEVGFRVNQLTANLNPPPITKKGAKDQLYYPGTITLAVAAPKESFVNAFQQALTRDGHLAAKQTGVRAGQGPTAPKIYNLKIDVAKQTTEKYLTRLTVPKGPPPPPDENMPVPDDPLLFGIDPPVPDEPNEDEPKEKGGER